MSLRRTPAVGRAVPFECPESHATDLGRDLQGPLMVAASRRRSRTPREEEQEREAASGTLAGARQRV